ncbi:hypothetical protein SAY87_010956 [Trapa incisa]|uniref:DUF4378 domain-containing protein n=1 Tax=Trapa incisa TaxID=236973 RepID=A0AAN7GVH1_9MYRT|nr:hypothetical protein SAY87_010956 [Trapa incisa]
MTKPSQRRVVRKDPSGCMRRLVSVLDFRHGSRSTWKLLASKRHGRKQASDCRLEPGHREGRTGLDVDAGILSGGHKSFNSSKSPCSHTPDEVFLEPEPKNSDHDVKGKLDQVFKFMGNGRVSLSKEVVDALRVLNLNEESFLRVLQDPTVENIEELISSDHNSSKQRKLFRTRSKSPEMKPPRKGREEPVAESVLILEPGPTAWKSHAADSRLESLSGSGQSEGAARAYFLLAEVKRMWKNVVGKERNPGTAVKRRDLRSRGERPEKKSPTKDGFFTESIAKPNVPNIYVEAKGKLSGTLSTGHQEIGSSSEDQSRKTLARFLALPDFNSPVSSPGRKWERNFEKDNGDEELQKLVEDDGSCLNYSTLAAETEPNDVVICSVDIEEGTSPATTGEDLASDVELFMETLDIRFEGGDNLSPTQQGKLLMNCMETHEGKEEEEALLLFIMSALQECGLSWNELYLKSQSSVQLLQPSLLSDTDFFFSNHPWYDHGLVLNFISEALMKVIDRYVTFCCLTPFMKPMIRPIPSPKDVILEAWEQVRGHAHHPTPLGQTLNQIVLHKDVLGKSEEWMDLRPDAESIGFEMGDEILDYLMEEYVDEGLAWFW